MRALHPRHGRWFRGQRLARAAAGSLAMCMLAAQGWAETWSTGGLSFRHAEGNARLLGASGTGSREDPIVLIEEITGAGPVVLQVHDQRIGEPKISPAQGVLSVAVVKVIVNLGPWAWSGFDLELRRSADEPSGYTDGLSFDQPRTFARVATADRFLLSQQDDEPYDRIRFDGGRVDPAEELRVDFHIVDANAPAGFYLVQRPIVLFAHYEGN